MPGGLVLRLDQGGRFGIFGRRPGAGQPGGSDRLAHAAHSRTRLVKRPVGTMPRSQPLARLTTPAAWSKGMRRFISSTMCHSASPVTAMPVSVGRMQTMHPPVQSPCSPGGGKIMTFFPAAVVAMPAGAPTALAADGCQPAPAHGGNPVTCRAAADKAFLPADLFSVAHRILL